MHTTATLWISLITIILLAWSAWFPLLEELGTRCPYPLREALFQSCFSLFTTFPHLTCFSHCSCRQSLGVVLYFYLGFPPSGWPLLLSLHPGAKTCTWPGNSCSQLSSGSASEKGFSISEAPCISKPWECCAEGCHWHYGALWDAV